MHQLFTAATILTPDETLSPGWLLVRDGVIDSVGHGGPPDSEAETFDLGDHTLVPGFVDIHVHGGGGFSLMTADPEEVRAYARWVVAHGVTSVLPTVVAADAAEGIDFVRAVAAATGPIDGGANVLGVNLEGPFVSGEYRGALPKGWLREPDLALLDLFAEAADGHLKLMTMATERNKQLLARALDLGIKVSVGHSGAASDVAGASFDLGATHVTHLFNAMRPFHHRDPGIVGAAFARSDVTVEIIADGVHLDPVTVVMAVHLFGPDRVALVTDAMAPAGLPGGEFRLGDQEARLEGTRMLLPDGTIAGGAATMDSLIGNVVGWDCATLAEAVRMASTVPAAVAGVGDRKGRIAPGYDADLVALTPDLAVAGTWVGGSKVHPIIGSDHLD